MSRSKFVLRLPRHLAGQCAAGCVSIAAMDGATKIHLDADLVDFSRFGSRFRLDRSLEIGSVVTLHIRDEKASFSVALEGNIRWSQLDDDGRWSHGCLFTNQVSWETFGELFLREFVSTEELAASTAQGFSLSGAKS